MYYCFKTIDSPLFKERLYIRMCKSKDSCWEGKEQYHYSVINTALTNCLIDNKTAVIQFRISNVKRFLYSMYLSLFTTWLDLLNSIYFISFLKPVLLIDTILIVLFCGVVLELLFCNYRQTFQRNVSLLVTTAQYSIKIKLYHFYSCSFWNFFYPFPPER